MGDFQLFGGCTGQVLEILKRLQGELSDIRSELRDMRCEPQQINQRLTRVEYHMGGFFSSTALHSDRVDRLEQHLERIERRLGLSE